LPECRKINYNIKDGLFNNKRNNINEIKSKLKYNENNNSDCNDYNNNDINNRKTFKKFNYSCELNFSSKSKSKSPKYSKEINGELKSEEKNKTLYIKNNNNYNNNINSGKKNFANFSYNKNNNNFSPLSKPKFKENNFQQNAKTSNFKNTKNVFNLNPNANKNKNKLNEVNSTLIDFKIINSFKKITEKKFDSNNNYNNNKNNIGESGIIIAKGIKANSELIIGNGTIGILKENSVRKFNENKFSPNNFNLSKGNNNNININNDNIDFDPCRTFSSNKKVLFEDFNFPGKEKEKEKDFDKDLNKKFNLMTSNELSKSLNTTRTGKYSFRTIYKDKNVFNKNIHIN
jgi:hypothetical protein